MPASGEHHPAFEEYCECIYELHEDDVEVIAARIAERLQVSRPAVSEMLRRLEDEQLVTKAGRSITLTGPATVKARAFLGDRPVGTVASRTFTRVSPRPGDRTAGTRPGLAFRRWEGAFDSAAKPFAGEPTIVGDVPSVRIAGPARSDFFGLELAGWITVPADAVYRFSLGSDDGSVLSIGDTTVVDNDGPHSMKYASGEIALGRGAHPILIRHFERDGGEDLDLRWSAPGLAEAAVPASAFTH